MSNLRPDQIYQPYRPPIQSRSRLGNQAEQSDAGLRTTAGHLLMPSPSNVDLFNSRTHSRSVSSNSNSSSIRMPEPENYIGSGPLRSVSTGNEDERAHKQRYRAHSTGAIPDANDVVAHLAAENRELSDDSRRRASSHGGHHEQVLHGRQLRDEQPGLIPVSTLSNVQVDPPQTVSERKSRSKGGESLWAIGHDTLESLRNVQGCDMNLKMAILIHLQRKGLVATSAVYFAQNFYVDPRLVTNSTIDSPSNWPSLESTRPILTQLGIGQPVGVLWPGYQALNVFWRLQQLMKTSIEGVEQDHLELLQLYFIDVFDSAGLFGDWYGKDSISTWYAIRKTAFSREDWHQATEYLDSMEEQDAIEIAYRLEDTVRRKMRRNGRHVIDESKLPYGEIASRVLRIFARVNNQIAEARSYRHPEVDHSHLFWKVPDIPNGNALPSLSAVEEPKLRQIGRQLTRRFTTRRTDRSVIPSADSQTPDEPPIEFAALDSLGNPHQPMERRKTERGRGKGTIKKLWNRTRNLNL